MARKERKEIARLWRNVYCGDKPWYERWPLAFPRRYRILHLTEFSLTLLTASVLDSWLHGWSLLLLVIVALVHVIVPRIVMNVKHGHQLISAYGCDYRAPCESAKRRCASHAEYVRIRTSCERGTLTYLRARALGIENTIPI